MQLSTGSAPKIEQGSSKRNKVKQVKRKKISHLLKALRANTSNIDPAAEKMRQRLNWDALSQRLVIRCRGLLLRGHEVAALLGRRIIGYTRNAVLDPLDSGDVFRGNNGGLSCILAY